MCFGGEFKLPLDLLRRTSSQKLDLAKNNFVSQLRKKLNEMHEAVRQQLDLRS